MACSLSSQFTSTTPKDVTDKGLCRSLSSKDLPRSRAGPLRRCYSENHLPCSIRASAIQPKMKNSRSSIGSFNIQLSGSMIPDSLKSFLLDPETSKELTLEENVAESGYGGRQEFEIEQGKKRANWIERLMELRNKWLEKQEKVEDNVDEDHDGGGDEGCEVEYEEDKDDIESEITIDREMFSSLLRRVSLSDTKLFSQLAFLSNLAYVIEDIKTKDLRRYYGVDFVTSSLEKKAEAEAIKKKIEQDSNTVPLTSSESTDLNLESAEKFESKTIMRPLAAYEIAASAASYVCAKDHISQGSEQPQVTEHGLSDYYQAPDGETLSTRVYKSEMAASVAASTMTALVAAGEEQKDKAAKDLQSLHSSPCEWFVCDDAREHTRFFVIQGSDSLASWQANLFFEPTKFEGTDVLVHRGIYEAAKGIYTQFLPMIKQHLEIFGERAKLQFTGHSLGGSLALLANLMLLTRNEVKPSSLLPVVTYGSPFVFCGGHKILEQLGLDENHVHCVMMHRDIVPRAFSCNYPNYVAQLLKRLNSTFKSHPCLNKNKVLYSPMGKIFILQPEEKSSPPHPLLPNGSALYSLQDTNSNLVKKAIGAFLNSPHPLETLSDPMAYGSEGSILRDHDSSNYLKSINELIRQRKRSDVRKTRKQRNQMWPLLTSRSPHAWSNVDCKLEVTEKILTSV